MTVSSADRGQVEDLLRTIAATDTTTMRKILRGSREETTKAFDLWATEHYSRCYEFYKEEDACGLTPELAYLALTMRKKILNAKLSLRLIAMLLVEETRRANIRETT